MQGVVDIATELSEAGFHYKARNRSTAWELDTGWYPTIMYESMKLPVAAPIQDPKHAVNRPTRPYQWLRREAVSNLRIMQALGRPRMTRQVLTPGQDGEPPSESEEGGADCREIGPTERLARYCAACYMEIPWCESQRAFEMLMSWFGERHQDRGSLVEHLLPTAARAGGTAPSPVYPRAQASSSADDVVDSVFWTVLISSKSDFGEGGLKQ
jgi:hypothetical protein